MTDQLDEDLANKWQLIRGVRAPARVMFRLRSFFCCFAGRADILTACGLDSPCFFGRTRLWLLVKVPAPWPVP